MKLPRLRFRRRRAERPDPHRLMPPEGVPITLRVATIGARFGAQITDILITTVAAVALLLFTFLSSLTGSNTLISLFVLLFFFIRVPYYAVTELIWNGQTLGKKMMSIKVVSEDGGPLTAHALVARNLMKEAEIFLPGTLLFTLDAATPLVSLLTFGWILATLIVPLANPRRRRLGDMMAGTYVVQLPVAVLLADVSRTAPPAGAKTEGYRFFAHQLDHYGVFELQTLEDLLRAAERHGKMIPPLQRAALATVAERVRKKIGYGETVPEAEHLAFLKAFYKAQRGHLEQRQLFGERRANKFHRSNGNNGGTKGEKRPENGQI
ncbi:MAG: hypothetical protein CSA74_01715 [Rhodobacterales bacterium]|nr:MAG: hypothetical protein CSA74_01715 [Rhodobacterales bacterium]